jgi:hypothetical protein
VAIQSFLPFKKLQNKEKFAGTGSPLASLREYYFTRRKAEGTLHPFLQKRTFFLSKNKKADPQRQIGFILQGHKTDPYIEVRRWAE